jgi:hypothetical protein
MQNGTSKENGGAAVHKEVHIHPGIEKYAS